MTDIIFLSFEPILSNRYIIDFDGIPSFLFKYVSKLRRVKGIWDPITIHLYNSICPSTCQATEEFANDVGSSSFIFCMRCCGPAGDEVQLWEIEAKLNFIDYGDKDWLSSESKPIIMEVQPVKVKLLY